MRISIALALFLSIVFAICAHTNGKWYWEWYKHERPTPAIKNEEIDLAELDSRYSQAPHGSEREAYDQYSANNRGGNPNGQWPQHLQQQTVTKMATSLQISSKALQRRSGHSLVTSNVAHGKPNQMSGKEDGPFLVQLQRQFERMAQRQSPDRSSRILTRRTAPFLVQLQRQFERMPQRQSPDRSLRILTRRPNNNSATIN
ncbi:hypothetical protein Ddc_14271 [Ditylenchus destructor]|nr:hypothetical protein Ddc_14271 [Ditylenchus destructor]